MKKLLLTAVLFAVSFTTFAQVGIGTTNPNAALDIVSSTQGLAPPRMTEVQMNDISGSNLFEGLVVYCTDCNTTGCLNVYTDGSWGCLTSSTGAVVSDDCTTNGFDGTYIGDVALSGASFSVTVKNDSFNTVNLAFAAGDIVLSGSGEGTVSVTAVNPTTANLIAGDSQLVTYTLTGTPDLGDLEAVWTKLSLNCTKTQLVGLGDATFSLPHTENFLSVKDNTGTLLQGVITNGDTFTIPYTTGLGSYAFYTTPIQNLPQEVTVGGNRDISLSWGGPNAFSSSGDIIVTINVSGDGSYAVPTQEGGTTSVFGTFALNINGVSKGNINLTATGTFTDLASVPGTLTGTVTFDFGGGTFTASVKDGWVLVLQYHHFNGTEPDLNFIAPGNTWPVYDNAPLGTDLSADATKFAHLSQAAAATIPDTNIKLKWYGESEHDGDILNFESPLEGKFRLNSNPDFSGINLSGNHTLLPGHTATLPFANNVVCASQSQGDRSLTGGAMVIGGSPPNFTIDGFSDRRWEMDTQLEDQSTDTNLYRVWVKAD
jgi:hypothetical protein